MRRTDVLRISLGIAVGLACFWLAVRGVSASAVLGAIAQARPIEIALAISFIVLATVLRAWRWKLLFYPSHRGLRAGRLWSIILIGQTLNIALPGRLGELARIYLIDKEAQCGKLRAVASIALEKVFDAVVLLIFVALISLLMPSPSWFEHVRNVFGSAVVLLVVLIVSILYRRKQIRFLLERLPRLLIRGHEVDLGRGLRPAFDSLQCVSRWQVNLALQIESVMVWSSAAVANYLTLLALGLHLPLAAALFIVAVLQLGTAVPSTPGKVGVFQYLCVLALTPFAVQKDLALSYGILLHLVAYAPPMALGAIFLARELPRLRGAGMSWFD